AEVNRALPVAWWTIYRVFDDQPPQLCAQASHAVPDIALDCWHIYRSGVYRDDTHFADACAQAGRGDARTVMTHCVAEDFGRAHRERIYTAHSLSERLSIVSAEHEGRDRGALLAVNLYRHRAQARFAPAELDTVLDFAGALLAVVQRHIELGSAHLTPAQRLQQHCPQLTQRELEVCERLLRGMSFEGIAADLGLSAATAKTYRNRAFERLGIHHRNALFALALPPSA
ncbi:MAG: LuxR C-terminal-related transcriptional regulator, partial [Solirubrobacteraceae bacterium]|nr:LuxR C-terminal-related transcriptional regulator [Solirubrobacteraceae bacterium]